MVPSGPNLTDCRHDTVYKQALRTADVAVMDSGYLALILRMKGERELQRISGLQILEVLLNHPDGDGGHTESLLNTAPTLWVVPNGEEKTRIRTYLVQQNFDLSHHDFYEAPFYETSLSHPVEDSSLLEHIQKTSPQWVILCVAGGKQEKLGLYLRNELGRNGCSTGLTMNSDKVGTDGLGSPNTKSEVCGGPVNLDPSSSPFTTRKETLTPSTLNPNPTSQLPAILCTGAAIAFLTGGQATIPKWADRLYLGWLFRILQSPRKYFYRYLQAARLPFVLNAWKSEEFSKNK